MQQLKALTDKEARDLAQEFIGSKNDERCLSALLRLHCIFGNIRDVLRCKKISRYAFELNVKGGRVDLALFHSDGGVSLVEVKSDGPIREIVSGIGQLFLYETLYLTSKPKAKPPAYIHKYLISPISGDLGDRVDKACAQAGVRFISYAPFSLIQERRDGFKKKLSDHGTKVSINA